MNFYYYLLLNIPKFIFYLKLNHNHIYLKTHKFYLMMLSFFLYKDLNSQFKTLIDFTCVDYSLKNKRFDLIYHLLSINYYFRILFKFFLTELDSVYSLVYLFPNISWYEREVWDLFGIFFFNNKHLKRILLDYGFLGHPLRKDFPLTGFVELVYSYFFSNVIQKKINLSQAFRKFETNTVWNQINYLYNK